MMVAKGLTILSVLINLTTLSHPAGAPTTASVSSLPVEPEIGSSPARPAPSPAVSATPAASPAGPAPRPRTGERWAPSAVHLTGWITLTRSKFAGIVEASRECGLNAVVMEVKDVNGDTFFHTTGKDGKNRFKEAVDACHEAGLKAIARVCIFKDKAAEEKYPGMRYGQNPGTKARIPIWTDPCSKETVEYNLKAIDEVVATGVDEVNLDYIRFPSGQERAHVDLPLPTKCRVITDFVRRVREHTKGVRLSLDVFGYVVWDENSARVGQRFEDLAPHVDAIYPMLYPDHFARGDIGFKEPSAHPYEVIRKGCEAASRKDGADSIDIVPWIQCFTLPIDAIRYGPIELLAQIQGARDANSPGYLVWSPTCRYQDLFTGLKRAGGAKDFTPLVRKYIPAKWVVPPRPGRSPSPGPAASGRASPAPEPLSSPEPEPEASAGPEPEAPEASASPAQTPEASASPEPAPTAAVSVTPRPVASASAESTAPEASASPEPGMPDVPEVATEPEGPPAPAPPRRSPQKKAPKKPKAVPEETDDNAGADLYRYRR